MRLRYGMDSVQKREPKGSIPGGSRTRIALFCSLFLGLSSISAYAGSPESGRSRSLTHTADLQNGMSASCTLQGNRLTCSLDSQKSSIDLDVDVANPRLLFGSTEYTIILTSRYLVVTLGAGEILSGRTHLGMVKIGGRSLYANSYRILDSIQDITNIKVRGNELLVETKHQTSTLDLSNPTTWQDVY